MSPTNYVLLYVDSPAASARFYSNLLDLTPVEQSPTFALFPLPSGVMLGLWSKHTVEPKAEGTGGGAELGFAMESAAAVDAAHANWSGRQVSILQAPTDLDFGRTFVATDPDGHRLRVFHVNMA
jgi:catechol 2,3-dioxygenase-like lactoylglutathione lyase family enzyme